MDLPRYTAEFVSGEEWLLCTPDGQVRPIWGSRAVLQEVRRLERKRLKLLGLPAAQCALDWTYAPAGFCPPE
jgi:hypothetical protein